MKTLVGLLKLYRIDSFLITILSFGVTLLLVKKEAFDYSAVFLGLSLGTVFVNFIYSINSYYDADIDAINKPYRPIPAGQVSKQIAKVYIVFLGLLSLLVPICFMQNVWLFFTLYLFPLFGILYSNSLLPLKKQAPFASLITALVLVLPSLIALLYAVEFARYWYYVVLVFGYCICLVPLKDIEDVKGDTQHGSDNWSAIAGERKLLFGSMVGLILLTTICIFFSYVPGVVYLAGVFVCSILVELFFLVKKKPLVNLYKTLILSNLILLVLGFLLFITVLDSIG